MGMTIDEAIKGLLAIKEYYNGKKVDIYLGFDNEDNESVDFAIDTMRKYQQIEQILKDIPYGGDATLRRIQEVVEDGDNT